MKERGGRSRVNHSQEHWHQTYCWSGGWDSEATGTIVQDWCKTSLQLPWKCNIAALQADWSQIKSGALEWFKAHNDAAEKMPCPGAFSSWSERQSSSAGETQQRAQGSTAEQGDGLGLHPAAPRAVSVRGSPAELFSWQAARSTPVQH